MVTGATDGIGLGFCEVLVDMGFNVVLISRNKEKLARTEEQLRSKREVKLKSIVFDFRDSADSLKYCCLVEQLKQLDIALLVNNVGTSDAKIFHRFSHSQIVDILNINCLSMAALSADVLPIMAQRQRKSCLINLSSYMEEKPLPFLALYAATKAFNKNLTESLWHEYPQVDVMCLKPMFVETPLSRQKKGLTVPDRRECARDALKELRWEHETYGHISHRLVGSISKHLIPDWFYRLGVRVLTKRALRKIFPQAKFD